ncbi:uncharacterized protein LTR77_009650 [Saxophila tyrrhenica]|uniref:VOC domain-containing protein n=1 Tax=Saxophila tyrrhenica TaxID=1690608 RepID=A0AAV9P238_9PEZI|nr:hypothetical protein LTR77_009650 [Saxophila tyrrhenica]
MSTPVVLPPSKLAHIVFKTNQMDRMKQFYCNFLGGRVVHANDFIAFITYDDEHHRIALVQFPNTTDKEHNSCGLLHVAFTFDSLKDLCMAYRQRKALGIRPGWYYQDPDGNQIEAQVDNYDNPDDATAFMDSEMFARNAFGADFDPEELCAALDRGESEAELKVLKDVGPRGLEEGPKIEAMMRTATVGV